MSKQNCGRGGRRGPAPAWLARLRLKRAAPAAAAARRSEEYFRAVVQDQTEVICRFRADGTLTFANDVYCRFFGILAEEKIGTCWQPAAHPDDLPLIQARLRTLGPERPVAIVENRVHAGNGRLHWMQFVNRGFFDAAGRLVEIQSVGRDITERKQAETALLETHRELEQRIEQLSRLAIEATLAEERERQAVAHDLHDGIGQILHVAKLKIDALGKRVPASVGAAVSELNALVADASRQVRSLTAQLSPPVLKDLGLVPAIHWLAEEMERMYGLEVEIEEECSPHSLPPAQSAILFRTIRELLINVAKHADTAVARVEVRCRMGELSIMVADEGVGIADVGMALAARSHEGGIGLASVRERIGALGGALEIEARPGVGTRVAMRMPYKQDLDSEEKGGQ